MKRICLTFFIVCSAIAMQAQRRYFIYLQSENKQTFSVKINNSTTHSSGSGYAIISKLIDSVYRAEIDMKGVPVVLHFEIKMNQKDHGFQLKYFKDKGWGLFDPQSLAILMPVNKVDEKVVDATKSEKETNSFADILSKASNDPTLKEKTEKKSEVENPGTVKTEPVKSAPTEVKESNNVKDTADSKTALENPVSSPNNDIAKPNMVELKEQPQKESSYKKTIVTRKSESSTTQGFGLVYLDQHENGVTDTIRLIIPNQSQPFQDNTKQEPKEEKQFIESIKTDSVVVQKDGKQEVAVTTKEADTPVTKESPANKNCSKVATDQDFFALRKQMAATEGDENMVSVAKTFFKTTCFSVSQIKNLCFLFLNDEGKYRFFDQAYSHVSDPESFKNLETEIKDEYYRNRFRAMLRN